MHKKAGASLKMKIEEIKNQCTACSACESVCPRQCININFDQEGFYYPQIDHTQCVSCGKCERVCHCLSINKESEDSIRHSFYGISQSKDVLQNSSSGGAFHHLSESVLEDGGVVFGASFDCSEQMLVHTSTMTVELEKLQKSKYIESRMSGIIPKIQKELKAGRKVLFCGTPCQVSGIKRVVPRQDNFITCDFVCHGVPSAMLFREHLQSMLKRGEAIVNVDFRPKDISWIRKYLRIQTNRRTIEIPYYLDSFYYGFMEYNAFLRRSCYNCQFRSRHISDLTIADFWGWQKFNPQMCSEDGISLIIANSELGLEQVKKIKGMEIAEIDNKFSDYIFAPKNYSEGKALRAEFYEVYEKNGFENAARKTYFKDTIKKTVKYRVKKLLGREK